MNTENTFPKFWKKAIKGNVGGRTLNKKGGETEFVLKGDPSDPSADKDNLTVEIFDADAEKYFKRYNKSAIRNGYIIAIGDHVIELDESNAVGDGYLKDLLKQPFTKMKKRVDEFTSSIPVHRLLEFAETDNKPIKTVNYLRDVIKKLEGSGTKIPDTIQGGGVKVTTI
jgi:hypothetical protein